MTKEDLQKMNKNEVMHFIRKRLSFEDIKEHMRDIDEELFIRQHRRFDMSGYEDETGQCTKNNLAILNEFADLGIYDYTSYLFLDFYKGTGTLYLQYFHGGENKELDYTGLGTTEIIYKVFEQTIFSGKKTRRRY